MRPALRATFQRPFFMSFRYLAAMPLEILRLRSQVRWDSQSLAISGVTSRICASLGSGYWLSASTGFVFSTEVPLLFEQFHHVLVTEWLPFIPHARAVLHGAIRQARPSPATDRLICARVVVQPLVGPGRLHVGREEVLRLTVFAVREHFHPVLSTERLAPVTVRLVLPPHCPVGGQLRAYPESIRTHLEQSLRAFYAHFSSPPGETPTRGGWSPRGGP